MNDLNKILKQLVKDKRFYNYLVIFLTLAIIFTLIYTTYDIYMVSLEDAKELHQNHQLELAKSASVGIKSYLNKLSEELKFASHYAGEPGFLRRYFNSKVDRRLVENLFIADKRGKIISSFGNQIPFRIKNEIAEAANNFKEAADTLSYYSSDILEDEKQGDSDSLKFIFMLPNSKKGSKADSVYFTGYVINFGWLIEKFIAPLKLNESDFAWMLDGKGRLIYHPNHREMLLRKISQFNENCSDCHLNFEVQKNMLLKKSGFDEYLIIGEPKKIMAFVTIDVGRINWKLAISTYLPSINSAVEKNFVTFFILSGASILLIMILGAIFFQINLKRVKAEESERTLQHTQIFQEKLNQASKLASIGELVDSVAHEINTPTGIISAETELLLGFDGINADIAEELKIIKRQTKRISTYTRSLLSYARRNPFNPAQNNIYKTVEECIFLLKPRLRNRLEIKTHFNDAIEEFYFDKGRIEQVIINILNNAIDALRESPEISVSVSLKNKSDADEKQEYVQIKIRDNGSGIPEENRSKIFDPFFSSKPPEQGTGLGLAITKAIIKRHNGEIYLESREGEGTTFYILLPYKRKI